jgi:predicted nucleic acid-binding protein
LEEKYIVVDTNILFSAFLSEESEFLKVLLRGEYKFCICESILMEIFKHKEKIIKASELSEDEVVRMYYKLIKRFLIVKEDVISSANWMKAYELCKDIDESDTLAVALTLQMDGLLWTGDKRLKRGLGEKGFKMFYESKSE